MPLPPIPPLPPLRVPVVCLPGLCYNADPVNHNCTFVFDTPFGQFASQYDYATHTLQWGWRENPTQMAEEFGPVTFSETTRVNTVTWDFTGTNANSDADYFGHDSCVVN